MPLSLLLATSALLLPPLSNDPHSSDGDWPGWRGADGSGNAAGAPPTEWSEQKNVRWKVAIPGKGLSSPVVWGERVYLTTAVPVGAAAEGGGEQPGAEPAPPPPGEPGGGPGDRPGRGGFGRGRGVPLVEHEFVVMALERADGKVAWTRAVHRQTPHQSTHPDGSFASPTLATDGERLYASFGSFGIFALDLQGEVAWSVDLGDMDVAGSFGEGSSPVLAGDVLVINWDHNGDSFLVALDRKTGAERWRVKRPGGTSWVTPVIVQSGERAQVVIASTETIAYDLATGAELWRDAAAPSAPPEGGSGEAPGAEPGGGPGGEPGAGGPGGGRGGRAGRGGGGGGSGPIASAVVHDGVLLRMAGGRGRGSFQAVRLERPADAPDGFDPVLWTHSGDTPHVPSPIAVGGVLYALRADSGILTALDVQTGEVVFGPERMQGLRDAYASPVAAGGRLYFAGRDGAVEVVAAGRAYESLAVNRLDDGFDASPAVAGAELFLRGRAHLYCIAEDAEESSGDL